MNSVKAKMALLVLVVSVLSGPAAHARRQTIAGSQEPSALKVAVDLVSLSVTVTDAKGRMVPGLQKEDFRVYEDGAGQSLSFFATEEAPVSWGLVLDRSGSMAGMIKDVYQAARLILTALALVFTNVVQLAQVGPETTNVLAEVRRTVQQASESSPNLVCKEAITSRRFKNGRLDAQKMIETEFRTEVKTQAGRRNLAESRLVTAIDGKEVRKGTKIPKAPYLWSGSTAIFGTLSFGSGVADAYTYRVTGPQGLDPKPVFVIEFATVDGQKAVKLKGAQGLAGKAWVDAEESQIVRLEWGFIGATTLPDVLVVDYGKTDVGATPRWLPQRVRAERTIAKDKKPEAYRFVYVAEYTDCRVFEVSVEIKP